LLRSEKPDVIHAHNWLVNSFLPLARSSDAPLVLSLHDYGMICPTKRLFYRGGICSGPAPVKCFRHAFDFYGPAKGAMVAAGTRLSEPWVRRRVDMFLSVSSAVEELSGIGDESAHRVVPNFVGKLPPPPDPDDSRLAVLPDEPFVLFFGDVSEDKGARHLIDTYMTLESPPPLVLVGRRMLAGPAREPRIVAPGALPHSLAIEALRRSLFVVVPSIWAEPFGIVALETAAAGKPIVASAVGGLRDIVVDEETGLLVPPRDPEGLRAALERMISDRGMRARMGEAALRHVKLFSPDVVVPRFEEAYMAARDARLKG
jgi:glycosyltransferase involved in cell wall biosynthesis